MKTPRPQAQLALQFDAALAAFDACARAKRLSIAGLVGPINDVAKGREYASTVALDSWMAIAGRREGTSEYHLAEAVPHLLRAAEAMQRRLPAAASDARASLRLAKRCVRAARPLPADPIQKMLHDLAKRVA